MLQFSLCGIGIVCRI